LPRQTIDVRHDLARERHFGGKARCDEVVLHVDDDERRLSGVDRVAACELALSLEEARLHGIGNDIAVHGEPLVL
jgi:hypothetical protein